MYHFIRDYNELKKLHLKGITKEIFIKQLKFLKKNFEIISYDDLEIILNKKKINKNMFCLLLMTDI